MRGSIGTATLAPSVSLKTKVKHGMIFPFWEIGAVNNMEWGLIRVQKWHKGNNVIRLIPRLSVY